MRARDLYEDLIRFYEFQMGALGHRDELKRALQASFAPDELRVFFLLPFFGPLTMEKLERKAAKAGIPLEALHGTVKRLIPEGLIDSYEAKSQPVYSRSPMICVLELQVCNIVDSPMRAVCTKLMNDYIEGGADSVPMKTPPYRVLSAEAALTGSSGARKIAVGEVVPDPRAVLPIDVVSEMIRGARLIAVADCYCRATKRNVGEPCGHPLETCFYFNELAEVKLNADYGRRIDCEEAMAILWECEQQGLVHNVSNCEGDIQTLCNCCACSCVVMKSKVRARTNLMSPSRFVVAYSAVACTRCEACVEVCPVGNLSTADGQIAVGSRCVGCGLCVSHCPSGALSMVLRDRQPPIYPNNSALWRRLNREALVGLIGRRLAGR